jgi:hypothetical protein
VSSCWSLVVGFRFAGDKNSIGGSATSAILSLDDLDFPDTIADSVDFVGSEEDVIG